ncbi:MAG: LysM peptidoglycan-binding domain-containing protein, partial [Moraxellaceae bacterium]
MKWPIYLSAVCPQSDCAQVSQSGYKLSQFPIKTLVTTTMLLLLTGCASKPVVNPVQSRLVVIPQYYTVQAGDTLSKIAARYSLDYREIARLNNIDSSYTIYRNQSIRLHAGGKDAPRIQVRTAAAAVAVPIQAQALPSQPTRTQPVVRNTPPVSRPTVTTNPPITPNLGNMPM